MEPVEIERYLDGWRKQAEQAELVRAEAEARARGALAVLVEVVVGFGARRAWLIGSLARGTFRAGSDIDVLVEGLTDEATAARAERDAWERTGEVVDVVVSETLAERWFAYHRRWGERLLG